MHPVSQHNGRARRSISPPGPQPQKLDEIVPGEAWPGIAIARHRAELAGLYAARYPEANQISLAPELAAREAALARSLSTRRISDDSQLFMNIVKLPNFAEMLETSMDNKLKNCSVQSRHRFGRYVLFSMIGFAFPLGLGTYHRSVSSGESYHQFYKFPKSNPRPVIVKYRADGILHRLLSPNAVGGTLSITNTGKPARVAMRMIRVPEGLTVHWESGHTQGFNLDTKEVEREVGRGESIAVHHTFYIGQNLRLRKVIFSGGMEIVDAASHEILLTIPIRILNAGGTQAAAKEEPCHEL